MKAGNGKWLWVQLFKTKKSCTTLFLSSNEPSTAGENMQTAFPVCVSLCYHLLQFGVLGNKAQVIVQKPPSYFEAESLALTKSITFIRNTGSCTGFVFWPISLVCCFYIRNVPIKYCLYYFHPIKLLPSQLLPGLSSPLAFLFLWQLWKTFPLLWNSTC